MIRRVLFQVHMWTGLTLGILFVLLGLSGSVLVFNEEIARVLNEEPSNGPVRLRSGRTEVEVIDSGTWASFYQKQILMHVESGVDCMVHMLGQPEQGDAYRGQMEKTFGGLRQFPLAALRMAKDATSYAAAQRASLALVAAAPEWVGGLNWTSLLTPPPFPVGVAGVPQIDAS